MTTRVALVTGAGVRLGRAISEGLAHHGCDVAVHFHSSEGPARETATMVEQAGRRGRTFQADLRDAAACSALIERVVREMGPLDVLVNSAASFTRTPIGETGSDTWDEIFALNVRAPFLLTQAARPHLRDGACVINIADLAGIQAWPSYHAHGAAKAALIHLTRSLARALGPSVRVNAIAPGAVLLPDDYPDAAAQRLVEQTPLERVGEADDVVSAVRYLVDARFVSGALFVVDGGRSAR